jgi:hypothetical protein
MFVEKDFLKNRYLIINQSKKFFNFVFFQFSEDYETHGGEDVGIFATGNFLISKNRK